MSKNVLGSDSECDLPPQNERDEDEHPKLNRSNFKSTSKTAQAIYDEPAGLGSN